MSTGRSFSFDGTLLTFTTRAGVFAYPHTHPTPPVDALIVYRSGAVTLSRTATTWTATEISLNATVGGVVVTLLLFGQGAQAVATKTGYVTVIRRTVGASGSEWPDAATQHLQCMFPIPVDWSGGAITVKLLADNSVGSNTVAFRRDSFRIRDATALFTIESATNVNVTVADTNVHLLSWTVDTTNLVIGDGLYFDYYRLGADASDTNTGSMTCYGLWAEYATA